MTVDIEVTRELERRCKVLIDNSRPDDISTGMSGSLVRFTMALAPIGYPFDPEPWMDEKYRKAIMTKAEFHGSTYDAVFQRLFEEAMKAVNSR